MASLNVPDDQCDSKCTGDISQKCGGGWRMAVYRTGYATGMYGGFKHSIQVSEYKPDGKLPSYHM